MRLRQHGDDLADFVRGGATIAEQAADEAARRAAFRARNDLRRVARSRFGKEWRVAGGAKGLAETIRVTQQEIGLYRVSSKAVYQKGRTGEVDLLWAFDTGPTVTSGKGKGGVAIPIKGQAPIAFNGRRYAWPSEAARMGWELEFAQIQGRDAALILGRRNRSEAWRPLWIWKKQVKLPKRFDLVGIHRKHAATMDQVWGEIVDDKLAKQPRRRLKVAA